ncbi:flagellar assembly protein FliH [Halopseudomonas yangmingensis]|uniref:Flagellar assembly protein FliH n=1 Tax=Halopseudomonas yangmingensis TaxID=1720063 RepID=A0A1I4N9G5_9GAMM|nr:flagellar assembly protein FliH [Halopseudomonas yangmingensis]SFM11920.1 flagellar assembly protein FliH [Halopseudomonas yangmingensis]
MSKDKAGDLIRAEQLADFSLWDLPSFDDEPQQVLLEREEQDQLQPESEQPVEELEEFDQPPPITLEELERIREEAYNDGFATGEKDGFHAGQLKARQEAQVQLDSRLVELEVLMQQLLEPIREQDQQIERMLLQLLESMLRQLVRRELSIDSSQIVQVLRAALRDLPMGAANIRIYLNPADFEAAKALRERHEENWRLLEDEQLLPGGCRIETEHSQVDASVETRLEQMVSQLWEQFRQQQAHPPEADLMLPESLPEDVPDEGR